MKKRLFLLLCLAFAFVLPSSAVLKEDSLASSLAVLRHELVTYHREQDQRLLNSTMMGQKVFKQLSDIMSRSTQNSLMLYSQKSEYVFDLAYACHQATQQYEEFQRSTLPFKQYMARANTDIARYDSLIDVLQSMPVMFLSHRAQIDRNVCLTLAINIRRMLTDNQQQMQEYVMFYNMTEKRLKNLNDYAHKRYQDIQFNIFRNGGDNYFKVLSNLNMSVIQTRIAFEEKYTPSHQVKSQWDVRFIIGLFVILIFYSIISIALSYVIVKILISKLIKRGHFESHKESFYAKRTCIILAFSVVMLAILLGVIRYSSVQSFIDMASGLLIEYTWLLAVILISLLLRVDGEQIKASFRIYSPLVVVSFIVIAFRIVLIPSVIVNLVFPPILLLCTIWQANVLMRKGKKVQRFDYWQSCFSMTMFVFALISSFVGYTLLAVQVLIWWTMQLTFILTLACCRNWLTDYRAKHNLKTKPVSMVWGFRLIYFVVLPSLLVLSFIISIYWSADVFNLSDLTWRIFTTNYIDSKNFRLSIFALAQVLIMWFLFNYINHTVKDAVKLHLMRVDPTTAASRSVLFINVLQVVVWGVWLLASLAIFHVSNTWLVVVSGGLSTGIGFAMKDILENIYYGISLMAGRIKVGDYIVCDGVRGRVSSISYTSTLLEGIDGSVIAFQNSQLFTKNYKNMTRNHGYELDILEVGVAYGTNIEQVRKLLTDAIMGLKCIYKKRGVKVVLKSFDDSCITLKVLVWVNVLTQYGDDGTIMECIYKTLNDNNIEIPFPQREITIKHEKEYEEERNEQ